VKANVSLRQLVERVANQIGSPLTPEPVAPAGPDAGRAASPSRASDVTRGGPGSCAGCGFRIGRHYKFCPQCGRQVSMEPVA
jgi:hypothetical protein